MNDIEITVHVVPESEILFREYLEEMRLQKIKVSPWVMKWTKQLYEASYQRKTEIQESLKKTGRYEDKDVIIH